MKLHCNKTRSFRPITILITNQTKPPVDLACFDCLRETETALDSLAGNRTRLSSTDSELIEMECQQMKSNENEITTHLNGSFAVPFTITVKTIVISNQDCFDGEWNALHNYRNKPWVKVHNDFKLVWGCKDLTRAGHLTKRPTYFRLLFLRTVHEEMYVL